MTGSDDPMRAAIAQQAADWFVTNQSGESAGRVRRGFMTWLRISPVHVEEYLRTAAVAQDLGRAVDDSRYSIDALVADAREERSTLATIGGVGWEPPPAPQASWLRFGYPAAAGALCTAALVAIVGWWFVSRTPATTPLLLATTHGERHTWTIADGSTVQLNSDSSLQVRFSGTERVVEMERGQAYFHVAKEPGRHFRVVVAGADVVAVGTEFDVRRHDEVSVVTVVEGHVAVYLGPPRKDDLSAVRATLPVHVYGGHQISVRGSVAAGPVIAADLRQAEAWRTGHIVFEQRSLAEIAEEFNHYAPIPIEIGDPTLRELQVSGAFDARDTESFLAFLSSSDDVRIERSPTRILVTRQPASKHRRSARPI